MCISSKIHGDFYQAAQPYILELKETNKSLEGWDGFTCIAVYLSLLKAIKKFSKDNLFTQANIKEPGGLRTRGDAPR